MNIFDPELQLIKLKSMITRKLKELLSELKKLKVKTILILDYKNIHDRKIIHLGTKMIACGLDIDEAFKSMHESIMTKITYHACKDWIFLDVIIKPSTKIFES